MKPTYKSLAASDFLEFVRKVKNAFRTRPRTKMFIYGERKRQIYTMNEFTTNRNKIIIYVRESVHIKRDINRLTITVDS